MMYKAIGWAACLFLSGFLGGCSLITDSDSDGKNLSFEDFSMETDQDVYLVKEGNSPLEITYAYINEGKHAFYPGNCVGYTSDYLEKLVDGKWTNAYASACFDDLRPPIKIRRGERYTVTIQLIPSTWDPARKNISWQGGDIEGTYRVREKIYNEWSTKKYNAGTLHSKIVFSNAFEIRRAP